MVSSSDWKGAGDEAEKKKKGKSTEAQEDFQALRSSRPFAVDDGVSADSF